LSLYVPCPLFPHLRFLPHLNHLMSWQTCGRWAASWPSWWTTSRLSSRQTSMVPLIIQLFSFVSIFMLFISHHYYTSARVFGPQKCDHFVRASIWCSWSQILCLFFPFSRIAGKEGSAYNYRQLKLIFSTLGFPEQSGGKLCFALLLP
jgi:hypothetical protein